MVLSEDRFEVFCKVKIVEEILVGNRVEVKPVDTWMDVTPVGSTMNDEHNVEEESRWQEAVNDSRSWVNKAYW